MKAIEHDNFSKSYTKKIHNISKVYVKYSKMTMYVESIKRYIRTF